MLLKIDKEDKEHLENVLHKYRAVVKRYQDSCCSLSHQIIAMNLVCDVERAEHTIKSAEVIEEETKHYLTIGDLVTALESEVYVTIKMYGNIVCSTWSNSLAPYFLKLRVLNYTPLPPCDPGRIRGKLFITATDNNE